METKHKIKINTDNLTGVAPLYCKIEGQINPQPAYIEIDLTVEGEVTVSADYSGEVGNCEPINVWSGRVKRIAVNPCVIGTYLADVMNDSDFMALIVRVADGYSEEWDGNKNKGCLADRAMGAIAEMEHDLEAVEQYELYDAEDWLDPNYLDADGRPCDNDEAMEVICCDVEVSHTSDPVALAEECESYVNSHQVVDGLEKFFVKTVELLKANHEAREDI